MASERVDRKVTRIGTLASVDSGRLRSLPAENSAPWAVSFGIGASADALVSSCSGRAGERPLCGGQFTRTNVWKGPIASRMTGTWRPQLSFDDVRRLNPGRPSEFIGPGGNFSVRTRWPAKRREEAALGRRYEAPWGIEQNPVGRAGRRGRWLLSARYRSGTLERNPLGMEIKIHREFSHTPGDLIVTC